MDVLFYDRKNKRQVRASELERARVIADLIQGDRQEQDMLKGDLAALLETEHVQGSQLPGLLSWHQAVIGNVAYRTPDCQSYANWNKYCLESDLVFLGLVEE